MYIILKTDANLIKTSTHWWWGSL